MGQIHRDRKEIEKDLEEAEEQGDLDKVLELLAELDSLDRHEIRR